MKRILLILLLLASPVWAQSGSQTFQDDGGTNAYNNCEDSKLQSNITRLNYGSDYYFTVGSASGGATDLRGVLRFPLFHQALADSGVTADEITSCTLFVRIFAQGAATTDTITAYQLDSFWAEGTGGGSAADTTDVGWGYRDKVANTADTAWTAGGSYSTTAGTLIVTDGDTTGFYAIPIATAICSTWVADTSLNFGVDIRMNDEASTNFRHIYSRNRTTASQRPQLKVTWTQSGGSGKPTVIFIGAVDNKPWECDL